MAKLELTLACWDYDRTRPLLDGSIEPDGIALRPLQLRPRDTFDRMLHDQEFHASELSLASYLILKARGDCPFVGLPVMLSRVFRHSCLYVNSDAGIERPEDLRGRRVGVPQYGQTAAVFMRGLLQHDYGVRPEEMSWVWRPPAGSPRRMLVPLSLEGRVRLEAATLDRELDEMLEAGDLDALATPYFPTPFLKGSPRVRRLFPNYKTVEQDYFRRTGIFPIMHIVVVRRDVYEAHPWVAASLYQAFCQAKDRVLSGLYDTDALRATLPWLTDHLEEARRTLGTDFWPYGVEANLPALEAASQYVHEQGLSARRVPVAELFAPELAPLPA